MLLVCRFKFIFFSIGWLLNVLFMLCSDSVVFLFDLIWVVMCGWWIKCGVVLLCMCSGDDMCDVECLCCSWLCVKCCFMCCCSSESMVRIIRYQIVVIISSGIIFRLWWQIICMVQNSFGNVSMQIIEVFLVRLIILLNVVGRIECIVCGRMMWCIWWFRGRFSVVVVLYWLWLIDRMLFWIILVENVVWFRVRFSIVVVNILISCVVGYENRLMLVNGMFSLMVLYRQFRLFSSSNSISSGIEWNSYMQFYDIVDSSGELEMWVSVSKVFSVKLRLVLSVVSSSVWFRFFSIGCVKNYLVKVFQF